MSGNMILGLVLVALGVVLLIFGFNQSQSVVDQVAETFTGRFTGSTMWYIIGGLVALVLGAGLLLAGRRGVR
ncbi:MAG TPA: DUF3185 family protein [Geminicoccaceae bacterium]|nr:DUF3185 family protein [Geminicoccaceae bacterium]